MADTSAYVVSSTDRSALVVISATLFMSWMILVSLVRFYIRITMNGPFGVDDLAALSANALGIANVGVIMRSVSHGLGTVSVDPSDPRIETAEKTLYVADILYIAAHCAAKMSVCLLLSRLGREKPYWKLCRGILLFITFWGAASILAISLRCNLIRPWDLKQNCTNVVSMPTILLLFEWLINQNTRWKAITSFDVLTEVLLLSLSVYLVWSVKMRWARKAAVIFAFAIRVSIIVIAITRQIYLNRAFKHTNILFSVVDAVICTEVLLHSSIMAATIPCLKPFVMAFNTGWGQGIKRNGGSYYDRSGASGGSHSTSRPRQGSRTVEEDERPLASGSMNMDDALRIQETREWMVHSEAIEMQPVRK